MNEEPLITTFIQLRKGFLKLASRFLLNEEDASDALQDAFCRLWPRRHQIHSSEEAKALAVTTIRNLCIDQVRKEKIPLMELDVERDSNLTETIEENIEKKEYEEESIDEIAKELNMQPSAVRMQLSRARKIIRECYRNRHSHEE